MLPGNSIPLLASATFGRAPAGLNSVKYPSSSVLRFPAKRSYGGVAVRSNDDWEGGVEEAGDASISVWGMLIKGPKERIETFAVLVRGLQKTSIQKVMLFAQVTLLNTLAGKIWGKIGGIAYSQLAIKDNPVMYSAPLWMAVIAWSRGIYVLAKKEEEEGSGKYKSALEIVNGVKGSIDMFRSNFLEAGVNTCWESLFSEVAEASGLDAAAAWLKPPVLLVLGMIGLVFSMVLAPQQIEIMKGPMVGQDINEMLEALVQADQVNPGRIEVIKPHLVKYLSERHTGMKTNDDIGGNAITTPTLEAKTEQRCIIENAAANEAKENKGSKEEEDRWGD